MLSRLSWPQVLLLVVMLALALLALPPRAFSQDLSKPTLVVALDKLDRQMAYAKTVMVAAPHPSGGGHYGFILNRPTVERMARIWPEHLPSRAVADPIYFGGTTQANVVVAITRSAASPGGDSLELAPGVWVMIEAKVIDDFMDVDPNAARYFMGYVRWREGVLAEEIRTGQVMLRPFDAARIFAPDTSKMYDELVAPNRKPAIAT